VGEARRRQGQPRDRLTVAVVIPTIPSRESLLQRAVSSVHAQTRKVDQFVVERDSLRTGAAQSRNRAMQRVTADVIAWLDDDDEFLPHHIASCMRVLELDPSVGLVYPAPRMAGNGRDPTAVTYQGQIRLPWGIRFGAEQEAHLRRQGSFIPMTHLVRTALVKQVNGFPEGFVLPDGRYRGEDEAYLIRLLDAGARFEHLDRKTWLWHAHPKTSTAGKGRQE
jgi:glycosyltransferase involved in cell wall biosynthesis